MAGTTALSEEVIQTLSTIQFHKDLEIWSRWAWCVLLSSVWSNQWLQGWSIHAPRAKEGCSGFPSAACQILPEWLRESLGKFPGEGGGKEAGARFPFPTLTAVSPATSAAASSMLKGHHYLWGHLFFFHLLSDAAHPGPLLSASHPFHVLSWCS